MNNWFTVKVKYTKQTEEGTFKRVTEPYLLAATSFTDAEARIYEELGDLIRGEFDVISIAKTEIHDIFSDDSADIWWLCNIAYQAMTDESEKSKVVVQKMLITAENAEDAYKGIQRNLKNLLVDFTVKSIVLSPIVDIFPAKEV